MEWAPGLMNRGIKGVAYNDVTLYGKTVAQCKILCEENTDYNCVTIDFSNGECQLSTFYKDLVGKAFGPVNNYQHHERICKEPWCLHCSLAWTWNCSSFHGNTVSITAEEQMQKSTNWGLGGRRMKLNGLQTAYSLKCGCTSWPYQRKDCCKLLKFFDNFHLLMDVVLKDNWTSMLQSIQQILKLQQY